MMTEKKILFFDIDGTLINEKKEVSVTTALALKRLKQAGHKVFICTGRTKCMLPKVVTDLEFDGFVLGGGTALEYEGKSLMLKELTYEQIMYLTNLLKKYNISYVYEGQDLVYMERESFKDERSYYKNFITTLGKVCVAVDSYEAIKASKITCVYPGNITKEDRTAFADALKDGYHAVFHERVDNGIMTDGLVEILPKGHTKGTGIEKVAELLGLNMNQTVGVGDSNNDLEMLEVVNTAICMGNGSKQAKALSDFITKGVNEDGILYAMETLGFIDKQ